MPSASQMKRGETMNKSRILLAGIATTAMLGVGATPAFASTASNPLSGGTSGSPACALEAIPVVGSALAGILGCSMSGNPVSSLINGATGAINGATGAINGATGAINGVAGSLPGVGAVTGGVSSAANGIGSAINGLVGGAGH
jgi:hypothetical protein